MTVEFWYSLCIGEQSIIYHLLFTIYYEIQQKSLDAAKKMGGASTATPGPTGTESSDGSNSKSKCSLHIVFNELPTIYLIET